MWGDVEHNPGVALARIWHVSWFSTALWPNQPFSFFDFDDASAAHAIEAYAAREPAAKPNEGREVSSPIMIDDAGRS